MTLQLGLYRCEAAGVAMQMTTLPQPHGWHTAETPRIERRCHSPSDAVTHNHTSQRNDQPAGLNAEYPPAPMVQSRRSDHGVMQSM